MDIWATLGIQATDSIEDIRRAYADQAKEHHPEDDPEGFMRLRNAYKAAIKAASAPGISVKAAGVPEARERQPGDMMGRPQGAERTFDFSGLQSETTKAASDKAASPPKVAAYDFKGLEDVVAEPQAGEQQEIEHTFDFTGLEEAADVYNERERQNADAFIAQAKALYNTGRRRRKATEWQALLSQPSLEALKRSEYFTWAFLDFLSASTNVPEKVRTDILYPFIEEWRSYWHGHILWGEFTLVDHILSVWKERRQQSIRDFVEEFNQLHLNPVKRRKADAWQALIARPEFEEMRGDWYFAYRFLYFLNSRDMISDSGFRSAYTVRFTPQVFNSVIGPLLKELAEAWKDNELGKDFEACYKKHSRYVKRRLLYLIPGLLAVIYGAFFFPIPLLAYAFAGHMGVVLLARVFCQPNTAIAVARVAGIAFLVLMVLVLRQTP